MEETNIPDQLTYHAPSQETTKEPKDALFMAARIISAIFTPFMVPFVAFLLLFFFTYLRILPCNITDSSDHGILLYHSPSDAWYIPSSENQWLDVTGAGEERETLSAIPDYDHELYRMFSDHVPDSSSTLYERNNHSYSALYGYLYQYQLEMENQHSHGQLWYDYRRITFIQFHFPVQSYLVALRFYFTGRNVRFRTNHRPPTYFKRSWRRFFSRFVLRYHWNFVYLKHNYINL